MTDIIERLRAKAYDVKPQDILNSKGDLMLKAANRIAELEAALTGMVDHYVELVDCGDCGNWDAEAETPVKSARAALKEKT